MHVVVVVGLLAAEVRRTTWLASLLMTTFARSSLAQTKYFHHHRQFISFHINFKCYSMIKTKLTRCVLS